MKPNRYTVKAGRVTYHYTFKELKSFLKHGFKEGNNGVILVGQDDKFFYYRGFGTIENPWKYIASISIENSPIFDGEMPNPEQIINPPKEEYPYTSYSFVIWDASDKTSYK